MTGIKSMNKEKVFLGSAVVAAIGSSLCCVLPLAAALFGLGAFGAASAFEQFRPYFFTGGEIVKVKPSEMS